MKLTILGNNGPYPAAGGACSGYLLSSDSNQTHVLIDCGAGVLASLAREIPWDALDAVILSHLHFDHMSDLLPMQYALQFHPRSAPLPVYAPKTPAQVHALLQEAPAYALEPMQDVQIGEIRFRFMPVRHPVETYALRAECDGRAFVYTGDTNILPELADFARDANVLLADAGLSIEHWTQAAPHLSARACGALALEAHAERLLLTHLNPRYTADALEAEARALHADAQFVAVGQSFHI